MADVEVRFEREDLEGLVASGTYLIDAMKRFGIRIEAACGPSADEHHCVVTITKGSERLSPLTSEEEKYFETHDRADGERLACQVKIEKAGGVSVMTKEKKKEEPNADEQDKSSDYKKEFTEMPLEKKIANLVQLEAIALGETVSFVINSPFAIFEKIGDVMAEFGMKLENESKAAGRPKEHTQKQSDSHGAETTKEKAEAEETIESEG